MAATSERRRAATRERILDVALELFTEQGYDGTSLREIAERLRITKAALYYHFERKEEILLELHLRLHALGRDLLERVDQLEHEPDAAAGWSRLLDEFIDQVLRNRDLFLLHQRNQRAFAQIALDERHLAENEDIEQRFRRILANPAIPLAQRVRFACALGAIAAVLVGAPGAFGDTSPDELAGLVRDAVHGLIPGRRRSTSRPTTGDAAESPPQSAGGR